MEYAVDRYSSDPRMPFEIERLHFCGESNAVVFACAGLRGLLEAPPGIGRETLVGFMFGEVVTLAGRPQFANLMLARLAPK